MFDRLEDIVKHYEELMFELNNPSVAEDQKRFRKLMKEQSDLTPLVETYNCLLYTSPSPRDTR